MSFHTTMTLKRAGAIVQTNVNVRIDNMSVQEASNMGGAAPYDSFWIMTEGGTITALRGDILQDEVSIDPKTNTNAIYRVFGNPEQFDFDHTEIPGEKVVGTT